jgi:hypothetical protein
LEYRAYFVTNIYASDRDQVLHQLPKSLEVLSLHAPGIPLDLIVMNRSQEEDKYGENQVTSLPRLRYQFLSSLKITSDFDKKHYPAIILALPLGLVHLQLRASTADSIPLHLKAEFPLLPPCLETLELSVKLVHWEPEWIERLPHLSILCLPHTNSLVINENAAPRWGRSFTKLVLTSLDTNRLRAQSFLSQFPASLRKLGFGLSKQPILWSDLPIGNSLVSLTLTIPPSGSPVLDRLSCPPNLHSLTMRFSARRNSLFDATWYATLPRSLTKLDLGEGEIDASHISLLPPSLRTLSCGGSGLVNGNFPPNLTRLRTSSTQVADLQPIPSSMTRIDHILPYYPIAPLISKNPTTLQEGSIFWPHEMLQSRGWTSVHHAVLFNSVALLEALLQTDPETFWKEMRDWRIFRHIIVHAPLILRWLEERQLLPYYRELEAIRPKESSTLSQGAIEVALTTQNYDIAEWLHARNFSLPSHPLPSVDLYGLIEYAIQAGSTTILEAFYPLFLAYPARLEDLVHRIMRSGLGLHKEGRTIVLAWLVSRKLIDMNAPTNRTTLSRMVAEERTRWL